MDSCVVAGFFRLAPHLWDCSVIRVHCKMITEIKVINIFTTSLTEMLNFLCFKIFYGRTSQKALLKLACGGHACNLSPLGGGGKKTFKSQASLGKLVRSWLKMKSKGWHVAQFEDPKAEGLIPITTKSKQQRRKQKL